MSNAINLQQNVMSLKRLRENTYDGAEVWADETLIGSAPAGATLYNPYKVFFPWNNNTQGQTIAETIWDKLDGYEYNPFESDRALLDPAAQLGDIVKINGTRSVLARKAPYMDALFATDIAAPQETEDDTEYEVTNIQQRLRRAVQQVSRASASLKVNVDNIIAEVTDGNGNFTVLTMTSSGIVVKGSSGAVSIKGSQIEAGSLVLTDNITFQRVSSTASGAASTASAAQTLAQAIQNGSATGTFINGQSIYSPTIYADTFKVIPDASSATEGAYELYCRRYSGDYATFRISCYYDNGAPYTRFYSPNGGYANWNITSTLLSGAVQLTSNGQIDTRSGKLLVHYGSSLPASGTTGEVFFLIA